MEMKRIRLFQEGYFEVDTSYGLMKEIHRIETYLVDPENSQDPIENPASFDHLLHEKPTDDINPSCMIQPVPLHSERLSSSRLSIGKYCTVVALQIQQLLVEDRCKIFLLVLIQKCY